MPNTPADNDPSITAEDSSHQSHISVYDKHTYHHTGIFKDPEENTPPVHEVQPSKLLIPVAIILLLILGFYGYLLHQGMPQKWTKLSNTGHVEEAGERSQEAREGATATVLPDEHGHDHVAPNRTDHENHGTDHSGHHKIGPHDHPPYYMVAPFAILLLCIAILPLIPATAHWWEHNLSKFMVAAGLGVLTLVYYYFGCNFSVEQHWPNHDIIAPAAGGFMIAKTIFLNAIIAEFLPFIVLLFSLFTITGGIRIAGNLKASPFVNSVILFVGVVLASFIGTTGAAMLLIRLLLETNKERKYKVHTIIFFIFCVCNCGGCLTPLGDPPLFLGYLRGVAFTWTFSLWMEWAFVNLILIALYFLWDTIWFYRRESVASKNDDNNNKTSITISGWKWNVPLLLGVVAAVAFLDPSKPLPGLGWDIPFYLREAVQLGLAAISLLFSSYAIRKENAFNFLAIGEVAVLFFGIFICMQAPLQILNTEGKNIVDVAEKRTGLNKEKLFFWSSGSLSSVLDNAPTYVVFFETAKSLTPNTEDELKDDPDWVKNDLGQWKSNDGKKKLVPVTNGFIEHALLLAVALGSVFMGAMTYIGNGPNFMVKAIAEQDGVKMPSFFGYMLYSCFILLPLLVMMTLLFL